MQASNQSIQLNSERVKFFESIWDETKSTHHKNMIAMLKVLNTDFKGILQLIRDYEGREGNTLYFKIEFILLQLSEILSFSNINENLTAMLHVIRARTDINPYDFDRESKIFLSYKKHKKEIIEGATRVACWLELFQFIKPDIDPDVLYDTQFGLPKFHDPSLVSAFLSAKFISYLNSWELIVGDEGDRRIAGGIDDDGLLIGNVNDKQRVIFYDVHCHIAEQDLVQLLSSKEIQNYADFYQYLYCKKYNLNILEIEINYRYNVQFCQSEYQVTLIRFLLSLSGKKIVDGVFLLEMIKLASFKESERCNEMLKDLFKSRNLIANWKEMQEILINKITPANFLVCAIQTCSMDVMDALLKNKKLNIKAFYAESLYREMTPIQAAIKIAGNKKWHDDNPDRLNDYLSIIKKLLNHDYDCVRINDSKGKDIFSYLNDTYLLLQAAYEKIFPMENVKAILDEINTRIYSAYFREQAFSFFREIGDRLPRDVVGEIVTYTMRG